MNEKKMKSVSKAMSYVLRHQPDSIGLDLDQAGWADVDDLIAGLKKSGKSINRQILEDVVADNDKQRFELDESGQRIRARQGHSIEVALEYEKTAPPNVLYHGTATRYLTSIMSEGLLKRNRHHVHMTAVKETAVVVGSRHGKPVILEVAAEAMHQAGHDFYVTGNGVWLTAHVAPEYLCEI